MVLGRSQAKIGETAASNRTFTECESLGSAAVGCESRDLRCAEVGEE